MYVHIKTYVCIAALCIEANCSNNPVFTNDEWVNEMHVFIQWYITQPQKGINFTVNYISTKRNYCSKTSLISVAKEIEMTGAHKFPSHDSKQWLLLTCL